MDLDRGWEFARVPTAPSIWTGPDAISTSSWRVLSVSSQEQDKEDGRASNVFDGDPKTIWHTEWSAHQPGYPHQIVIDLGSTVKTEGIRILPRQTSPQNGRPKQFELYLSNNRSLWGEPVVTDAVPNSSSLCERRFHEISARYLKLVFQSGQKPEPFLSLAEIGLIKRSGPKNDTDWSSQYNIASVSAGSDRFDLSQAALSKISSAELRALTPQMWESAVLPHSASIRSITKGEIWQGVAYYRRKLVRPSGTGGKRFRLEIQGAMQSSDLWFNGQYIASRRGGYLPLTVDVTPWMRDENTLLVRVDNRDNPLIPPGKPQADLDFMYGNGMYRNAKLEITSPLHVTDPILANAPRGGGVYVVTDVATPERAELRIKTHLKNDLAVTAYVTVVQDLVDRSGRTVASAQTKEMLWAGTARNASIWMTVRHPSLWSPDAPNLYRLQTSVFFHKRLVDSCTTTVGIRTIKVSRSKGFVINGKSIHLVGTNRHQDYPWVGPALSDAAHVRDAMLIRQAGHNIVRLSHYPQSPEFLDACDRLGLMVIPCIPGWQFLNSDPRFNARVDQDIRELIRRDRNHPCVAFWEASLNETYPPAAEAKRWRETAKSEGWDCDILTSGDAAHGATWDVAYNQWKDDLSRPQDAAPDRPGYIREYGDYEFGGDTSSSRVRIGAGLPKLLQEAWNHVWSLNKFRVQYPWTLGEGTWEMFDSNVPWSYRISACGLADIFRRPKPSFWFFASQESKIPVLKIAADWQPGTKKRDVLVFTNSDFVNLYVNGKLIGTAHPERGKASAYDAAKPFDGSNTANLKHPPVIFRDVPFAPGVLMAKSGSVSDAIYTAGKPVGLRVWTDDLGVKPQANDLVFVRAALIDAAGHICPDHDQTVHFTVSGSAFLAGEANCKTEMGVASALIRVTQGLKGVKIGASISKVN